MNYKVNEKKVIDTRSFPEIWKSLSADYEQPELRHSLIVNRCCSTPQTIWNWANGNTQPTEPLVLQKIAEVVSKFLSARSSKGPIEVKYQTLFPAR